jgi:hypothetical protein
MKPTVNRVASVIPSSNLVRSVALWERVLGTPPTFVDGTRWAQFDTPTGRICLAGTDGVEDGAALMLKIDGSLDEARQDFVDAGFDVTSIEAGPHEMRCVATDAAGAVVILYAAPI